MKFYHTATQEDYDALMIELDNQGVVWGIKRDKLTERNFWDVYKENTFLIIEGCSLSYGSLKGKYRERHSEWPLIEYKAKGENMTQEEMKYNLQEIEPALQEAKSSAKKLIEKIDEYLENLKPKFKVGDIILSEIFIDGSGIIRLEEDLINYFSRIEGLWYIKKDCEVKDTSFGAINKKTRYATPEEIAEYEVALTFHKHGRKPFEVKEGDILRDDKGNIFFVGFPNNFKKEFFTRGIYTLLKTAEEYNEWLENK